MQVYDITEEVLSTDGVDDRDGRPGLRWPKLRRIVEPLLLLAAAVAGLLALRHSDGSQPTADPPAVAYDPPRSVSRPPPLVVPPTAHAGDRITVVGYRYRSLCGEPEVRLDHSRVGSKITSVTDLGDPAWVWVFVTVDLPANALAGLHQLDLYGPMPGYGQTGPTCGGNEQHLGQLGNAAITLS
jgi:hypothetical protein